MASPASSSSRTTPTSSSTCRRRRRRAVTPTAKSESPTSTGSRSARDAALSPLRLWLVASRPRTLPAAVAPVLVGTSLAGTEGTFKPLRFACALIGSIFIQIGTNLANDYSDARRGADTEDRLGPVRVTAGGLVPPRQGPGGNRGGVRVGRAAGAGP